MEHKIALFTDRIKQAKKIVSNRKKKLFNLKFPRKDQKVSIIVLKNLGYWSQSMVPLNWRLLSIRVQRIKIKSFRDLFDFISEKTVGCPLPVEPTLQNYPIELRFPYMTNIYRGMLFAEKNSLGTSSSRIQIQEKNQKFQKFPNVCI